MTTPPKVLRELVQANAEHFGPDVEAGVASAALLVTEWIDASGSTWLVWVTADAQGQPLSRWRMRGMATELLEGLTAMQVAAQVEES